MSTVRRLRLFALGLLVSCTLGAQAPTTTVTRVSTGEGFDFTIPNIMRGPELYGRAPTSIRWSADSRWIHFPWNAPGTDWREPLRPYRVRATAGATPERLTLAQADSALPYVADGPVSPDGRSRVAEANGDIYLVPFTGSARRLTQTVANESRPTFSSDGRTVYFLRDNNAVAMSLAGGEVRQLTDIRAGPAPTDSAKAVGQRGRLEQQQHELFEVVRDRRATDSAARADRKAREAAYHRSSPIYLASGLRSPRLMAHGMVDQNVMYQDILRLEQRLIELGKTNWSLASYPVEDHGFVRPSSWADEYRRIFELFESSISRPGGAPK